jgi:hypothetical protein
LVNGKIVNFCGFIDSEGNRQTGHIITAPAFMLVKVPGSQVKVGHFPIGVIPLERLDISFKVAKTIIGSKYKQFPVTLAYAITDYKCQGETYSDGLLTDLKTPLTGTSGASANRFHGHASVVLSLVMSTQFPRYVCPGTSKTCSGALKSRG